MVPLAYMLKLYRAANEVTLRELAPQIGISHPTLGRIESGRPCDLETWLKLERWLLTDGNPEVRKGTR